MVCVCVIFGYSFDFVWYSIHSNKEIETWIRVDRWMHSRASVHYNGKHSMHFVRIHSYYTIPHKHEHEHRYTHCTQHPKFPYRNCSIELQDFVSIFICAIGNNKNLLPLSQTKKIYFWFHVYFGIELHMFVVWFFFSFFWRIIFRFIWNAYTIHHHSSSFILQTFVLPYGIDSFPTFLFFSGLKWKIKNKGKKKNRSHHFQVIER